MTAIAQIDEAVFIQNDQVKTSSLKVAELFGKQHKDVLRKLESLDCSMNFTERNFTLSEYLDSTGRKLPMYEMTKDGFIFLVMGFTGAKAAQIKEAYINTFNQKDNRGMAADSVDITLDDSDNALEIPSIGAEMKVWIGWTDTGLIYKGAYLVTGGSHTGTTDTLSLSAESTDLAEAFRQKRERSFHKQTLQDIFQTIAYDYELNIAIHPTLASREIAHLDQNDSDANIITRLADENDAIATVKNGTLLLLPIGESQTASGLDLPAVELLRSDGDQHNYSFGQSNNKVDGVKAFYHDKTKGEKQFVIVGSNSENPKEIRFIHRDKKTAELAASAEFNRCKRAEETLTYNLAKGRADLIPEQQFTFIGLKQQINEIVWLGKTVTHSISESSGFTTRLELEIQLPNADDVSALFDDKTKIEKEKKPKQGSRKTKNYNDYTGVKTWYAAKPKALLLTEGDQTTPLILTRTYKTKQAAQVAVKREWGRIQKAKK